MHGLFILRSTFSRAGTLTRRTTLHLLFAIVLALSFASMAVSAGLSSHRALAFSPNHAMQQHQTSFTLDGVTVALDTPILPGTGFVASRPGDAIQGAIAVSYHPYREFSVIAVPFGFSPGSEAVPTASAGGANNYRAALHAFRVQQGGHPSPGPATNLFGQRTTSEVSQTSLNLTGIVARPTLIVEWVVEAGQRLWIVRVAEEQTQAGMVPLSSLSAIKLSSVTLDRPTTLTKAIANHVDTSHVGQQQHKTQRPHQFDLSNPSWWSGTCDSNNFSGSYPLGDSYQGMLACGPRNTFHVVHFFSGAWGVGEWQCVELSMRYLYMAYNVAPYGANGSQVVWNYSGNVLQKISNGTSNAASQSGDVLSYGPTNSTGHTSVVTSSSIDNNGNGSINVIEENASSNGAYGPISVRNWVVQPVYGMSITGWLHHPSSPPPSPSTRGIVLRRDGTSGYVLDGEGNITPFGGAPAVTGNATWSWDIARGIVLRSDGVSGYVLDGWGGIHPFGGAPTVSGGPYWQGWDIARGIVLRSDGVSGYVLDGWGGVHPFGGAPPVSITGYWQGWDIARGLVLRPDGVSGYVLDGWGGIHPFGNAPPVSGGPYWQGWDIARGIVLAGDGSNLFFPQDSGYVLDGYGGVHPFNNAPAVSSNGYWSGQDRARGLAFIPGLNSGVYTDGYGQVVTFHGSNIGPIRSTALRSDGSGYVLDGYGNIIPFGGAPAVTGNATWNWDIARGLVLRSDGVSGYTLDGWGGVHPFGGAPPVNVTGYWPGWDIARGIVLRSDGVSGYVLDGYGAVHPFGGAPNVTGFAYWPGWDIARGIVLRSDGVSGYTLDGYGGVHPFGGAPTVTGFAYWSGWDIARGIVLRSDGVSGYTLDGWGAVHPFGGAPAINVSAYWPGADVAKGLALTPGSDSSGKYINIDGGIGTFQ